jgi:hypothetical protein
VKAAVSAGALATALPLVAAAVGEHAGRTARVGVVPQSSLADEPVHVRITGLHPRTRATVGLRVGDAEGRLWQGSASFRADGRGTIDLDRTAPRTGSYAGVWAMGLLASLTTGAPSSGNVFSWPANRALTFRINVRVRGRRVAATSFRRAATGIGPASSVVERSLSIADTGIYGRYYTPASTGSRSPAVLAFGGSAGGLSFTLLARILAARGYPTLALAYFKAPGLPPTLSSIPLEYFAHALAWLRAQPDVDPSGIVVVGTSRGSEAA